MNKTHWNTIYVDGSVPDQLILEWIDDSYNLIKAGIKKKVKKIVAKKNKKMPVEKEVNVRKSRK